MCWYGLTNLIIRADHESMVPGDKTIVSVDPDMDETDYCRGCSPNCITIRGVTITYLFIHHYIIRHTHYHHELRVSVPNLFCAGNSKQNYYPHLRYDQYSF
jgi:hypothetical protein